MVNALQEVGRHVVAIYYYDSRLARTGDLVYLLQNVFNKAGWHVETYPKPAGLESYGRLTIKYDRQHQNDIHRAVMAALRIGGLIYGEMTLTGGEFLESHIAVRLIVGGYSRS